MHLGTALVPGRRHHPLERDQLPRSGGLALDASGAGHAR